MIRSNSFYEAMVEYGLNPPPSLEEERFYRFPGLGKEKNNKAGWCLLYKGGQGGIFGDFSSSYKKFWQKKGQLSVQEEESFKRQYTEAHEQAKKVCEEEARKAKCKAKAIWKNSIQAEAGHPYLIKKGIQAYGARLSHGDLVLPIQNVLDEIRSLQFISSDGSKKFLPKGTIQGCYSIIGIIKHDSCLCIAEGFATAATIHEATNYPVAIAFSAQNLTHVAKCLSEKYPGVRLIICSDYDGNSKVNTGLMESISAAKASGAEIALPCETKNNMSIDFNDLFQKKGLNMVCKYVVDAKCHEIIEQDFLWGDPRDISSDMQQEPYPIDCFPKELKNSISEIAAKVQVPVELASSSALTSLSLAAQSFLNVKRPGEFTGPVSLYFITIADSGERKSTCDGYFMEPIKQVQKIQKAAGEKKLKDHAREKKNIEIQIEKKEKELCKASNFNERKVIEEEIIDLEGRKVSLPQIPKLLYTDFSCEALCYSLAKIWPSGGICCSEGGLFFGSQTMSKDYITKTTSLLNAMWSGETYDVERRTSESYYIDNARLTISLMVQCSIFDSSFKKSEPILRGSGFLARFLICQPKSLQGERFFKDEEYKLEYYKVFCEKIKKLLHRSFSMSTEEIGSTVISCSDSAKKAWIHAYNEIEKELKSDGRYRKIKDVASKAAENIARLAALFQVVQCDKPEDCIEITGSSMQSAAKVIAWYLESSKNILCSKVRKSNLEKLDDWIRKKVMTSSTNGLKNSEVAKNGPHELRKKDDYYPLLQELAELNRIRFENNVIQVNPKLLCSDI